MSLIIKILKIYTLLTFINFLLSLSSMPQNRWTVLLERICEPAVKLGHSIAQKIFSNRRFNFDIRTLSGFVLMLCILFVINIIF